MTGIRSSGAFPALPVGDGGVGDLARKTVSYKVDKDFLGGGYPDGGNFSLSVFSTRRKADGGFANLETQLQEDPFSSGVKQFSYLPKCAEDTRTIEIWVSQHPPEGKGVIGMSCGEALKTFTVANLNNLTFELKISTDILPETAAITLRKP